MEVYVWASAQNNQKKVRKRIRIHITKNADIVKNENYIIVLTQK